MHAGFAFTNRYQWVSQTLSEGEAWVLSIPFERVRDEFSKMTNGAMEVAGLFVEISTGERLRWGRKHIHSESVLTLGVDDNRFISPYPDLRG